MFSSNPIRNLPTRKSQDGDEGALSPTKHPRPASDSPGPPHIESDLLRDAPLAAATADLPQFGGSHGRSQTPAQQPPKRSSPRPPGSTPGRSRVEIVLNVSPFKPLPGHRLWNDADLREAEEDDELVASTLLRGRKRPHPGSLRASSTVAAAPPIGPATSTQVPGKRPRGRPKGWTKSGNLNNRPAPKPPAVPGTGQKRRGRPPRQPSPTPRDVWNTMAPPRYVPLRCEWTGCRAELQNTETLRRHLRKVHGRARPLVCRWAKCGNQARERERLGAKVEAFGGEEELHTHVDERHLLSFVWHLGDGHKNSKPIFKAPQGDGDGQMPAYLLGPDGEQVTPWVKGQKKEDFATWQNNRRRLKEILAQANDNAPSVDGDEDEKIKKEKEDEEEEDVVEGGYAPA